MENGISGNNLPSLEVSVNLDEKYHSGEGQLGRITKVLDGNQQERYLNSSFRNLLKYVLSEESKFNPEQQITYSAIRERINNESDSNKVLVKLYDEDDMEIQNEFYSAGEIYLDDIVQDKTGEYPDLIKMGIAVWNRVG